jgi:hypothetical protein
MLLELRKLKRLQLSEEIKQVRASPLFGKFFPFDAHHIQNRDCYLFAGWRYPLKKGKHPLMGTAQRDPEGHAVAFCEKVFNREMKIREGAVKPGNALFLALSAQRCSGRRNITLVVGREQFIQRRDIPLIPDDFDIMTHECFVFFC